MILDPLLAMHLGVVEPFEPKRRELVQDRAFVWNRVTQNHVKGRESVGRDEKERLTEIKNFAHFPAPQFFDPGKID